jgi:hypothetical protein
VQLAVLGELGLHQFGLFGDEGKDHEDKGFKEEGNINEDEKNDNEEDKVGRSRGEKEPYH